MVKSVLWVSAAGVVCACAQGAAAAVMNGDFSAGLTGWTWTPDVGAEGAMVATTAAGPFATGPAFRVNPGNASGSADLGGTLSQSVFLAAGAYTLMADLAIQNVGGGPNADGGTISIGLGIPGSSDMFDVGVIAGSTTLFDSVSQPFVVAADGMFSLELRFTRNFQNFVPNIFHWADNVAIVPTPAGALAFAGAGLALAARRRR